MEYLKEGSFLEELDELNVEIRIRAVSYTHLVSVSMNFVRMRRVMRYPFRRIPLPS